MDPQGRTAQQLQAKGVLMRIDPSREEEITAFIRSIPAGSCVELCREIARKASQSADPAETLSQAISGPRKTPIDMERIFRIIQADRPTWREGEHTKLLWERQFGNVDHETFERAVYHYLSTSNMKPSLNVLSKALMEIREEETERDGGRSRQDLIVQRYLKTLPRVERNGVWYDHPWSPEVEREALERERRGETRYGRPVLDGPGDWGSV